MAELLPEPLAELLPEPLAELLPAPLPWLWDPTFAGERFAVAAVECDRCTAAGTAEVKTSLLADAADGDGDSVAPASTLNANAGVDV
jgi:hypothetical protein